VDGGIVGSAMDEPNRSPRPRLPVLVAGGAVAVLLAGGVVTAAAAVGFGDGEAGGPRWRAAEPGLPSPGPSRTGSPARGALTLSATGDIVLGNAPKRLPPRDGAGFFAAVRRSLDADLVMGNLEQPLTEDTGVRKCKPPPTPTPPPTPPPTKPPKPREPSGCHQFRAPPSYAAHLRDAGFHLLNQANNHGNDYGAAGYRNTQRALERYGLRHTGAPGQITVLTVKDVSVAVVGFSAYAWSNSVVDIGAAKRVVRKAAKAADLVVVQVHMGAEGSDKVRTRPGTEIFLGENRGDPVRFSHAVIDAGADLVVGHGPHVMRALEFYKGRLIAYSLGNFAGGGQLSNAGRLGWGAVLKVSLHRDGAWAGGRFLAT
jgi:hypothetical protein